MHESNESFYCIIIIMKFRVEKREKFSPSFSSLSLLLTHFLSFHCHDNFMVNLISKKVLKGYYFSMKVKWFSRWWGDATIAKGWGWTKNIITLSWCNGQDTMFPVTWVDSYHWFSISFLIRIFIFHYSSLPFIQHPLTFTI